MKYILLLFLVTVNAWALPGKGKVTEKVTVDATTASGSVRLALVAGEVVELFALTDGVYTASARGFTFALPAASVKEVDVPRADTSKADPAPAMKTEEDRLAESSRPTSAGDGGKVAPEPDEPLLPNGVSPGDTEAEKRFNYAWSKAHPAHHAPYGFLVPGYPTPPNCIFMEFAHVSKSGHLSGDFRVRLDTNLGFLQVVFFIPDKGDDTRPVLEDPAWQEFAARNRLMLVGMKLDYASDSIPDDKEAVDFLKSVERAVQVKSETKFDREVGGPKARCRIGLVGHYAFVVQGGGSLLAQAYAAELPNRIIAMVLLDVEELSKIPAESPVPYLLTLGALDQSKESSLVQLVGRTYQERTARMRPTLLVSRPGESGQRLTSVHPLVRKFMEWAIPVRLAFDDSNPRSIPIDMSVPKGYEGVLFSLEDKKPFIPKKRDEKFKIDEVVYLPKNDAFIMEWKSFMGFP